MKRVLLLAALALGVSAAPAAAQSPYVVKFKPGQVTPVEEGGAYIRGEYPQVEVVGQGGWDGGAYLPMPYGYPYMEFKTPQAMVEFFVRTPAGNTTTFRACAFEAECVAEQTVKGTGDWTPVILADPKDEASIQYIDYSPQTGDSYALDIDDVAFSTVRQPDTTIVSAVGPVFTFGSTVEDASYMCAIDRGEFAPCKNPSSFAGLPPGPHSLAVYAVDAYGAADNRSPARADFVIAPPPPPPPPNPDRDKDGVPDTADNCPDVANSDQADTDKDGVGNACEVFERGDIPPKPGETSVVQVLSGEVFVKLPTRTPLGFSGLRAPLQAGEFVPLKGSASIPLGAEVDTRKGEVEIDAAANSFASTDRRAKQQSARMKAAIFRIKQKRAKAKAAAIATDVSLLTPPGATSRCTGRPAKGTVVRSISMVVKGYFRALGGASTATAKSATFNTTDRCDGTLTEVGRGSVSLAVKGQKRPVKVKAGRAYLVKAKLFAARKGKKPAAARRG